MSRTGSVLAVLLAIGMSVAQPPKAPTRLDELGPVVRSQPDFYGAIARPGKRVEVAWAFSAASVELGGSVRLTLTIRDAVNPRELARPDLAKSSAFTETFSHIEPVPADEPPEDAKSVELVYLLRPRNEGKFEIAPPKYQYFRPGTLPGKEFQTPFFDPLTLTVTKPVVKAAPPVPMSGPESFFEPAGGSYAASGTVPRSYWLSLLTAPPLVLAAWVLGWRWMYPDAARLARLRRNRVVRRTLDRLRAAHRVPDPAAEMSAVFRDYLTARYGLPPGANTPGEVLAGLRELKFEDARTEEASELLSRCDSQRFSVLADGTTARDGLIADAIRLVRSWEGAHS